MFTGVDRDVCDRGGACVGVVDRVIRRRDDVFDLSGQRFGVLLVESWAYREALQGASYWTCVCECGRKKLVRSDNLKRNKVCLCKRTRV